MLLKIKNYRIDEEKIVGYFKSMDNHIVMEFQICNKREQHTIMFNTKEERDSMIIAIDNYFSVVDINNQNNIFTN